MYNIVNTLSQPEKACESLLQSLRIKDLLIDLGELGTENIKKLLTRMSKNEEFIIEQLDIILGSKIGTRARGKYIIYPDIEND